MKKTNLNPPVLMAGALVCCALQLHAQTAPAITTQPADQAIVAGSNATIAIALSGTGPFNFQWQCNGSNLPVQGVITTVAGGGSAPDGFEAINASLVDPRGVVEDIVGNLYIADQSNNRIRKVDTNGIITTVAGNGTAGYSGDGGEATNANINYPLGVAVDSSGNLFIADWGNNRIRMVGTNGIISTVAGNGTASYSGDGGPATNASLNAPFGVTLDSYGNLFIADTYNGCVRKVDLDGIITTVAGGGSNGLGDGGSATNASVGPTGVTTDPWGNLFIADAGNNRIREVDTDGIIRTIAGDGSSHFSGDGGPATNAALWNPTTVALDGCGDLLILDEYNQRVRMVAPGGIISTVAGNGVDGFSGDGGPATNATLNDAFGVAIDYIGNLLIADSQNGCIRKVSSQGPIFSLPAIETNSTGTYDVVVTSLFGSVTSRVATVVVVAITSQPQSQGILPGSNATLSVTASGYTPFSYQWYLNGTPVAGLTNSAFSITGFNQTNVGDYTVVLTTSYGSVTSQTATLAFPPSVTTQPSSLTVWPGTNVTFNVTVDGVGPFIYQWQFNGTNLPTNIITTVAGNGGAGYNGDGGAAVYTTLDDAQGAVMDASGNLYIADTANNRIRKVDTNGIISTLAGRGPSYPSSGRYSGDGGMAITADLNWPTGVAVDASGNMYIADNQNQRIRMVNTSGIITTVAGNGGKTYSGDGGAATNTSLNYPEGVALDALGNLYIADTGNSRIRKVDTNGIITTVAGGSFGVDGGAATNASLNLPGCLAFDSAGSLYIADQGNGRVRKLDTNGIITTVAGNGIGTYAGDGGAAINASLYLPRAVNFDAFGNLYIADNGNSVIRKVDINGIITTVAGNGSKTYTGDGGTATNAGLDGPCSVTFDASGNLYITDSANNRIREVFLYASYPTLTLAGVGASNAGNYAVVVSGPCGSVTSAVANLTVQTPPLITVQPDSQTALPGNSPLFSLSAAGSGPIDYLWYLAGTNLVQSGTNSTLTLSSVSAYNAGNYTVVVSNAYGSVTSQIATLTVLGPLLVTTQPANQTAMPGSNASFSVTMADTGPCTYQWQFNGVNYLNNIISTVAGNGARTYAGDGGAAINASLYYPGGVALDASGNLCIADTSNQRIRKVDTNGNITTVAGGGSGGDGGTATNASLQSPYGIAFDAAGNLYIADSSYNRIRKVGTNGIITTVAGNGRATYAGDGGLATNASLNGPRGVALDAAGGLYIADYANNRIRKVDTNGIIRTVAGSGGGVYGGYSGDGGPATYALLGNPFGLAVDFAGNLYIGDFLNDRIRKVDTNGIITTVAGNGGMGFAGDGGTATNAELYAPRGVALDACGDLYIADCNNCRIRKMDANGFISTVAGTGAFTYSGDGGTPTNASLYEPYGVALDALGNLYIADTYNERIRKVLLYAEYPTFTLDNVGVNNAGSYTVVVTSPYGSVTSAVATLTVEAPPVITAQPASQKIGVGSNCVLSVAVAGSGPFEYSVVHGQHQFGSERREQHAGGVRILHERGRQLHGGGHQCLGQCDQPGGHPDDGVSAVGHCPVGQLGGFARKQCGLEHHYGWHRPVLLPVAAQWNQFPNQYHHDGGGQWNERLCR